MQSLGMQETFRISDNYTKRRRRKK